MTDVCVTVPKYYWGLWLDEGDLPSEPWSGYVSHFWFSGPMPKLNPAEDGRVYIVAHGKLRGYAPLVGMQVYCHLRPGSHCFMRQGGAVACTIDEPIRGFQGWRYRWWKREDEKPFPEWRTP